MNEPKSSYRFGQLYGLRWGGYSVVVAATSYGHAKETFIEFLGDRGIHFESGSGLHPHQFGKATPIRTLRDRTLLIGRSMS